MVTSTFLRLLSGLLSRDLLIHLIRFSSPYRGRRSSLVGRSPSPSFDISVQHAPVHQTPQVRVMPQPTLVPVNPPAPANYVITEEDKANMGKNAMPSIPFQNQDAFEASIGFRKLGYGSLELNNLVDNYDYMCRDVIRLVRDCKFTDIEEIWFKFWSGAYGVNHNTLLALCSLERVQEHIIEVDLALYQTCVDILIPNVLLSQLTPGMTQACRTFAKNIDVYLRKALQNGKISDAFIKKKIQAIKYMQQGMKRYTSLNHLAHAARGVLMKGEQVGQMHQDYQKVDINAVHQQAGWICGCDSVMVHHVNNAFKDNLQRMSSMEVWAEWLESIVDQVLAKYHDKPASVVANVGKQFLLNWSFYTSMIIRDLTLRSAMSFGSFTLIRLLADDYMYYLIESKIAKAGKQQLITVIRQEKDWPLSTTAQEYIVPANDE
uniref:RFX1-4/6/8-like BCD domain-containing protein n=1 Tax=Caenorhabditis japonica TaxID=281687 RepID=A0A8R1E0B6_CAEJA